MFIHACTLGAILTNVAGLSHSRHQDPEALEPEPEFEVTINARGGLPVDPHNRVARDVSDSTRFWVNESFCLNFLHIPKTGGTTVESVRLNGSPEASRWGAHDKNLRCSGMTYCGSSAPVLSKPRCCPMKDGSRCPVWHTPPSADAELESSYRPCETFCVVRNPAARFRSQFVWSAPQEGVPEPWCSTESLKKAVDEKLESLKATPYQNACHYVPQTEFWQGGATCQHIVKQENFVKDFTVLMRQFDLDFSIKRKHISTNCEADFDPESLRKLQEYYAADYAAFNYSLA